MGALPSRTILKDEIAPELSYEVNINIYKQVVNELCSSYNRRLILVNNLNTTKQEMMKLMLIKGLDDITRDKYIEILNKVNNMNNEYLEKIIPYYLVKKSLIVELMPKYPNSLSKIKCNEYFNEQNIFDILLEIGYGLKVLNSNDMYHGNLKPGNVLFTYNGHYILGDYGQYILPSPMNFNDCHYLSPEILKNSGYNRKCDIWSYGCLIYYIVSNKTPFNGNYYDELVLSIFSGEYPKLKGDLEIYNDLLSQMLVLKPHLRIEPDDIIKQLLKIRATLFGQHDIEVSVIEELSTIKSTHESLSSPINPHMSSSPLYSQFINLESIQLLCNSKTPITEKMIIKGICFDESIFK